MRLLTLVSVVIIGIAAAPAYAEPSPPRLFVPVLQSEPDAKIEKLLHAFEAALGQGAMANEVGARRFERSRSREPIVGSYEEVARIEALAETAVKQLGSGRLRQGRASLEQVENELAGERGDQYRRERGRVQTLFDACTLSSMLLSRAKRRDEAAAQMMHCVRDYPGFAPEGEPEIQPLFDAAAPLVSYGALRIEADAECIVRANGLELSKASRAVTLPAGEYRVQIECGHAIPARVHMVRVEEDSVRVEADPLDESVHTLRGLWLRRRETSDSDGQALGRILGASVVLLIAETNVVRVRADGRDLGVLAAGEDVRAIIALLEPETDGSVTEQVVVEPTAPPSSEVHERPAQLLPTRSPLEFVAGTSLVVVGAGALAVGWVLYAQRYSLRTEVYAGNVPYSSRDRFAGLGIAALGVSTLGALLVASAEPFLVSDDGSIPTAAWVLAGGGLALAAAGLGFGLAHHCEPHVMSQLGSSCGFANDATFGPLLALHAVPLLALPAMYGLRQLLGGGGTVVLGFDGTSGRLAVSGAF